MTTWDYTNHAEAYAARPNYAPQVIDDLVTHVGLAECPAAGLAVDVGSGTGNLALLLAERGVQCVAVEPNSEMRRIGIARTEQFGVRWIAGRGERMGLSSGVARWVTMGSSFNTMSREAALAETHRVLAPGGFFTCMWNHRNLDDPVQQEVEALIRTYIPDYAPGTRREDQRPVIEKSRLFIDIRFDERPQVVRQPLSRYVEAWRSTRNLAMQAGDDFERVIEAIEKLLSSHDTILLTYWTRSWTARRIP